MKKTFAILLGLLFTFAVIGFVSAEYSINDNLATSGSWKCNGNCGWMHDKFGTSYLNSIIGSNDAGSSAIYTSQLYTNEWKSDKLTTFKTTDTKNLYANTVGAWWTVNTPQKCNCAVGTCGLATDYMTQFNIYQKLTTKNVVSEILMSGKVGEGFSKYDSTYNIVTGYNDKAVLETFAQTNPQLP